MGRTAKIILNIVIFLVVAGFIWYIVQTISKEEVTYSENQPEASFSTPYEKVSSVELPDKIDRFELHKGNLFITAGESIYIYDTDGNRLASFPIKQHVRDITADDEYIYILYPASIEVYTTGGELSHEWEACSELSDYCSFTLAGGFVFVTDAENKNICKYTKEGNFVTFIQSPKGFIIPNYSFDITVWNDTIYCSNSGRHQVETYTLKGDFIAAFGSPGTEPGSFAGCCNPVYIAFTPDGELITSEKGNPRVSLFSRDGEFKEVLLNAQLLGGGNKAYQVKSEGNRIFIAGKNTITVYAHL